MDDRYYFYVDIHICYCYIANDEGNLHFNMPFGDFYKFLATIATANCIVFNHYDYNHVHNFCDLDCYSEGCSFTYHKLVVTFLFSMVYSWASQPLPNHRIVCANNNLNAWEAI